MVADLTLPNVAYFFRACVVHEHVRSSLRTMFGALVYSIARGFWYRDARDIIRTRSSAAKALWRWWSRLAHAAGVQVQYSRQGDTWSAGLPSGGENVSWRGVVALVLINHYSVRQQSRTTSCTRWRESTNTHGHTHGRVQRTRSQFTDDANSPHASCCSSNS